MAAEPDEDASEGLGRPVYDFQPDGIPQIMSEELEEFMHAELEAGTNAAMLYYDRLPTERARQFRDDPAFRQRIRDYIEESGVTTISVTLTSAPVDGNPFGWDGTIESIRRWQTYLDAADWMQKALEPDDLLDDGINLLLGMQNADALAGNVDRVDELYDFGVRIMQLTYNSRNLLGDGCTERTDVGLSNFGVEVVERLNDLGMVVDVSHCGHSTAMDAIEVSDAPPAFTHTTCRAVYDHPRGKTDEELQAMADAGGYVGVVALPSFLGGTEDIEAMIDHIDHLADLIGPDRIWISTDWGVSTPEVPVPLREGLKEFYYEDMGFTEDSLGFDEPLGPMTEWRQWHEIPKALLDRGYSAEETRGICGENFLDYWRTVR